MNKLLLLILFLSALFSCRKDAFITNKDASIRLSADSLSFDTVFTSTGSVTKLVKIINSNEEKLLLSEVRLMGGAQSHFSINIDGAAGPARQDLELGAGDSLYVFVAVRIDPGSSNLPFVIQDSILVAFNGNQQYVQLQAWGQNAHFLHDQTITGQVTWDNSLPYVILGGLRVDTNATLSISRGCRIYFHADAPLLVDGSLQVSGDKYDSTKVIFQSDRLDEPYRDFPGSWPGIYLRSASHNNHLQFAVIRNAYQGIVAMGPSAGPGPQLTLDQCIIDNSYDAGILGVQSSIRAANCLVSNCGKNIVTGYGGDYNFIHCTAASFSNNYLTHIQPVLSVSNYFLQGGTPLTADLHASFINCIFWGGNGNVDNEVLVSRQGNTAFSVNFSHCLWRVKTAPAGVDTAYIITNNDPLFDSIDNSHRFYDFHLKAGSPAIHQGLNAGLPFDLDGNPRTGSPPDLGCYQHP